MSGPDMNQSQVAIAILQTLGDAQPQQTIDALATWFRREGGAGPQWGGPNLASYNPINTTLPMPGSHPINSVGVQAYTSWAQGIQATVLTLQENQRGYAGIRSALASGADCPTLAHAVGASAWGTPDFSNLCGHSPPPPPPPGPPAPPPSAGQWHLSGVVW